MDDLRVRKASELLGSILSPDVAAKADQWSHFYGFWKSAAGDSLAAHSRPVDIRNGIVFVETDHPGWIQLLQLEQNRLLTLIRKTFPSLEVTGIAFKLAKDGSIPGTIAPVRSGQGADSQENTQPRDDENSGFKVGGQDGSSPLPTIKETLAGVSDDSFRSVLSSLAKSLIGANKDAAKAKAETQQDKNG